MRISWLAVVAATLALGGSAHATVNIDFQASQNGTITFMGSSLGSATSIDFGGTGWTVFKTFPGDGSGLGLGDGVTITSSGGSTVDLGSSTNTSFSGDITKDWTAGGNTFDESFTAGTIVRGSTSLSLELTGTLTENGGPAQNAFLDISVNNAGGGGIGAVATNSSTSLSTPGPIPGTGLAGLAALALAGLYTRARRA